MKEAHWGESFSIQRVFEWIHSFFFPIPVPLEIAFHIHEHSHAFQRQCPAQKRRDNNAADKPNEMTLWCRDVQIYLADLYGSSVELNTSVYRCVTEGDADEGIRGF